MSHPVQTDSPHEATRPTPAHRANLSTTLRHRVLLCEVEPLPYKSAAEEIRVHKDLRRIADNAPILLNIPPTSPESVVTTLITALVAANLLPSESAVEALNALVGHEPYVHGRRQAVTSEMASSDDLGRQSSQSSQILPVTIANLSSSQSATDISKREQDALIDEAPTHWHRHILGPGFIVPFAQIAGLNNQDKSVVAIARLSSHANLGVSNDTMIRFVAIVLGPMRDVKETKSPFEVAHTLSSLLQDDGFFHTMRRCDTDSAARQAIHKFLARQLREKEDSEGSATEKTTAEAVFARTGRFAGGLIDDLKRRYNPPVYYSDWKDGLRDFRSLMKYLSTTVWLYFAIIMPTIAFGALNADNTENAIGVIETLVSQAFAGIVFSVFAGQPLTVVMTTAPLTVFIHVLHQWCNSLEIDFLQFYAWTGLWTALILIVLVVTDACYIMKYCGHFTEEIFATLIAALFISEYIKPLIKIRQHDTTDQFLLAFLLATGTFLIATLLLNFRRSFLLKPIVRDLLSDFGVPIAIVTMTATRRAFLSINIEALRVPDAIGLQTSMDRSWFIPLFDLGVAYIFLAAVSGLLLATLFFLDQNISSILVNRGENKLRKGPGYYIDLVVVAVIVVVQSLLGLPWTHAALPHSPLHARQLADVEEYEAHGRRYERVVKSRETRWTGFLTHIFIGLSILAKDALALIPLAVLYGFFLFLGIGTLDGNALWDRILLLFTQPEKYPPNHYVRRVRVKRIHLYTLIQLLLLVLLWFVKSNFYIGDDTVFNTGLLFPFIIALFIPVRLYLLPLIFSPSELRALSMEEVENVSDVGITV